MEQAKRECILREAAKVFARFGFKKSSIDEIARRAGVGKGTVYLAAASKGELFCLVLEREIDDWVGAASKEIDPAVPADQLLERLSRFGFAYLDAHPLLRDLLFGHTRQELPDWADRLHQLRLSGRRNALRVLALGVEQGLFRDDIDVDSLATLLLDLQISAYLFHNEGDRHEETIERLRSTAFEVILRGVLRPEVRKPAGQRKGR